MELEYYKEFVTLAEEGNFMLAADSMYMAQSSLSRHIQYLEKEYGISLFDRSTRRVQLSEEGALFLPYAQQIAFRYEKLLKDLEHLRQDAVIELSIGQTIQSLAAYGILELLGGFENCYPQYAFREIEEINGNGLFPRKYDFMFLREMPGNENPMFDRLKLAEDMLTVVMPLNHPLAGQTMVTLKQLEYESFILTVQGSFLNNWCRSACKEQGFVPRVIYQGVSGHNMIDALIYSQSVSILARKPAEYFYKDRVAFVDLAPTVPIDINLVWPKEGRSRSVKCFVDFVKSSMH